MVHWHTGSDGRNYYGMEVYLQIKLKTGYMTIATCVPVTTLLNLNHSSTYNFNGHYLKCDSFDGRSVNQWWSYREKVK